MKDKKPILIGTILVIAGVLIGAIVVFLIMNVFGPKHEQVISEGTEVSATVKEDGIKQESSQASTKNQLTLKVEAPGYDKSGGPFVFLVSNPAGEQSVNVTPDSPATLVLPKGSYTISVHELPSNMDQSTYILPKQSEVVKVDGDTEVTISLEQTKLDEESINKLVSQVPEEQQEALRQYYESKRVAAEQR